jgi:hypothetical protein
MEEQEIVSKKKVRVSDLKHMKIMCYCDGFDMDSSCG